MDELRKALEAAEEHVQAEEAPTSYGGVAEDAIDSTVYDVDVWTRRQGEVLAGLCQASEKETRSLADAGDLITDVCVDAFNAAFAPSLERTGKPPERRAKFFDTLEASGDLAAIRQNTALNLDLARIAAEGLLHGYCESLRVEQDPLSQHQPPALLSAMAAKAATDAAKEVRATLRSAADLAECAMSRGDPQALARSLRSALRSSRLRGILERVGRYISLARCLQSSKVTTTGSLETTGITLSGDLSAVVPSELAMLGGAVPVLRNLHIARLLQRQAMSWRKIRRTEAKRGPIVVMLDESGSMKDVLADAKAIAAALAWVARKQKREVVLMSYSSQLMLADLSSEATFLQWLEMFLDGGTIASLALAESMKYEIRGADHVIITDGDWDEEPDDQRLLDYRAWCRKHGVTVYGISVGCETPQLKAIADQIWNYAELGLDSACVQSVLSI
jgi:uncharacterized protein with von Willebrand factor type A (vWA) domain